MTLKFPYSVSNDEPEFYEEAEGHAILNKTKNIVETKPTKAEAVSFLQLFLLPYRQYMKLDKLRILTFFFIIVLASYRNVDQNFKTHKSCHQKKENFLYTGYLFCLDF